MRVLSMKVLVKDCASRRYVKDDNQWTDNPLEAREFSSSVAAVNFCVLHHVEKAEVVLKAPNDRYDVHLPLSKECLDG